MENVLTRKCRIYIYEIKKVAEDTGKRVKFGEVEEFIGGAAKEDSGNPIEADDSENLCVCGN